MFRAKPLLLVGVLAVSLLTAITPSASAAPLPFHQVSPLQRTGTFAPNKGSSTQKKLLTKLSVSPTTAST